MTDREVHDQVFGSTFSQTCIDNCLALYNANFNEPNKCAKLISDMVLKKINFIRAMWKLGELASFDLEAPFTKEVLLDHIRHLVGETERDIMDAFKGNHGG